MAFMDSNSTLYNEWTFYDRFVQDLKESKSEVIIESPFITTARMKILTPIFEDLVKRKIKTYVITRDPKHHEPKYELEAEREIRNFEVLGVQVFISQSKHHRKLAIIDRKVLWEGSLNILSQSYSKEMMRRIDNPEEVLRMFAFLKLDKFLL